MEIQPEKEERTELIHSQIVAPLTAVEIQPEKEVASRGIKFLAVEIVGQGALWQNQCRQD